MKNIILLAGLMIFTTATAFSQKYGHINFGNLIAQMSETKAADAQLETMQKDLVAKGETMAANFQKEYEAYMQKVNGGTLTPLQQQEQGNALKQKQQEILAFEQDIRQQMETKRQELLKPIIEKAQKAIDDYAKANGYTMVFDTSVFNSVLCAH
ncbi:MAG: OmpH family outer membrane protein [Bacteroidota bacterium]